MKKKKLFTFIDADDSTPIQKLALKDLFILIIKKLTYNEESELLAEDVYTQHTVTLYTNLMTLIKKSTNLIREGKARVVTLNVSSKFKPVLNDVLESPKIANYYDVQVTDPDIDYDIDYFIRVRLEVK